MRVNDDERCSEGAAAATALAMPDFGIDQFFPSMLFAQAKRILVCGSRTFTRKHVELARPELALMPENTVIVHGGQGVRDWRGVIVSGCDLLVGELAEKMGFQTEVHPVPKEEWLMLGGAAGPKRNLKMLRSGIHLVLAFWDGHSPGTRGVMKKAREMGIPVRVIEFEP